MNIECVVEKLEKAVQQTYRVTGKNLTLPILSTLHLSAYDGKLTIRATNLELGVEVLVPARVNVTGETTVPADVFSSFLSSIPNEQNITLEQEEGVLKITTPTNKTKITTQSVEDFPNIPHLKSDQVFVVKKTDLVHGMGSVSFSASISSIKPELASVYMYKNEDNTLCFVATDSFRLAEKNIVLKKNFKSEPILIPAKNVIEIVRILGDEESDVEVVLESNQISFQTEGVYITSRTIDGTFPDYKQIIPHKFSTEITLLKEDLLNALKVVNVFSNKLHQLKLHIDPQADVFEITTQNTEVGETVQKINATIEGEGVNVTFNYKYVVDCFSSITSDSLTLKLNTGTKPMVITPIGDTSFLYLVMPMNV